MFSRSFKNASGHHLILIKRCFHRSNIKFRQIWVVNSKITQSSDISQKQVFNADSIRKLNPSEVVDLWKGLKSNMNLTEGEFESLFSHTVLISRSFTAEQVSQVLKCIHETKLFNKELVRSLSRHIVRIEDSITPKEIKTILNFYIMSKLRSAKTLDSLMKTALRQSSQLDAWGAISILRIWSHLKMPKFQQEFYAPLRRAVCIRLMELVPEMTSAQVAGALNTLSVLNIPVTDINIEGLKRFSHDHLLERLCHKAATLALSASARDVATSANGLAALDFRRVPFLRAATDRIVSVADESSALDLVFMAHAAARLEFLDATLFEEIGPRLSAKVRELDPHALALTAWAFQKTGFANETLVNRIAAVSVHKMPQFKGIDLAMTAKALAHFYSVGSKTDVSGKGCVNAFFSALSDELLYRGTIGLKLRSFKFTLRELTDLSNALKHAGICDPRITFVLNRMIKEAIKPAAQLHNIKGKNTKQKHMLQISEDLNGHNLSRLLASINKNSLQHTKSFPNFLATLLNANHHHLSPEDLTRSVHALAGLQVKHKTLFKALLNKANDNLGLFSPNSVATILASFAKLDVYKSSFVRRSLRQTHAHVAALTPASAARLLTALGDLRHRDEIAVARLSHFLSKRIDEVPTSILARTLRSTAELRCHEQTRVLHQNILAKCFSELKLQSPQVLGGLAHTLCMLDASERFDNVASDKLTFDGSQISLLLSALEMHQAEMPLSVVRQLQIVEAYLRTQQVEVYEKTLCKTAKDLLSTARLLHVRAKDLIGQSSKTQREVGGFLNKVGIIHRQEVSIGPFTTDFFIGKNVALEFDGPSHFFRDTNMRTAHSLLRTACLTGLGIKSIPLPYQEWQQCTSYRRKLIYAASIWRYLLPRHLLPGASDENRPPRLGEVLQLLEETEGVDPSMLQVPQSMIRELVRQHAADHANEDKEVGNGLRTAQEGEWNVEEETTIDFDKYGLHSHDNKVVINVVPVDAKLDEDTEAIKSIPLSSIASSTEYELPTDEIDPNSRFSSSKTSAIPTFYTLSGEELLKGQMDLEGELGAAAGRRHRAETLSLMQKGGQYEDVTITSPDVFKWPELLELSHGNSKDRKKNNRIDPNDPFKEIEDYEAYRQSMESKTNRNIQSRLKKQKKEIESAGDEDEITRLKSDHKRVNDHFDLADMRRQFRLEEERKQKWAEAEGFASVGEIGTDDDEEDEIKKEVSILTASKLNLERDIERKRRLKAAKLQQVRHEILRIQAEENPQLQSNFEVYENTNKLNQNDGVVRSKLRTDETISADNSSFRTISRSAPTTISPLSSVAVNSIKMTPPPQSILDDLNSLSNGSFNDPDNSSSLKPTNIVDNVLFDLTNITDNIKDDAKENENDTPLLLKTGFKKRTERSITYLNQEKEKQVINIDEELEKLLAEERKETQFETSSSKTIDSVEVEQSLREKVEPQGTVNISTSRNNIDDEDDQFRMPNNKQLEISSSSPKNQMLPFDSQVDLESELQKLRELRAELRLKKREVEEQNYRKPKNMKIGVLERELRRIGRAESSHSAVDDADRTTERLAVMNNDQNVRDSFGDNMNESLLPKAPNRYMSGNAKKNFNHNSSKIIDIDEDDEDEQKISK